MKNSSIRVACAQINSTVGGLGANKDKILEVIGIARLQSVDVICFPELALVGYPPEDLLFRQGFVENNLKELKNLAASVKGIIAIVGFVERSGQDIFNAAAVIAEGKVKAVCRKMALPNYGVFDEKRYFKPGDKPLVFIVKGKNKQVVLGVNICEDIWDKSGPLKFQAGLGVEIVFTINASPFYAGKIRQREKLICGQAGSNHTNIAYCNMVGGQDELVFDGRSMIVDALGRIKKRGLAFNEDLLVEDIIVKGTGLKNKDDFVAITGNFDDKFKNPLVKKPTKPLGDTEEIYRALVLGLKDYASKNGFKKVVIGLSGGIDSSLVAVLAADALGKDNVIGVFMGSRYSSKESEVDAEALARNLGIEFKRISIEHIYKMYNLSLEPHFAGYGRDITEENLQARIRGNLLMALSNKFGWLVLATGNKSEMSAGYATLYGDMAGGLAVIKDVPKTLVYKLCRWRNSLEELILRRRLNRALQGAIRLRRSVSTLSPSTSLGIVREMVSLPNHKPRALARGASNGLIPERVFTKAPTAELRLNQKDSDSLPPYDILDAVLKAYVEENKSVGELKKMGFDKFIIKKIAAMVDRSEYKRRQSAPGIKITPRAFGKDRRMPITNKYRG